MKNFKGLTGSDAKLEFALCVLHAIPNQNTEEITQLCQEAREAEIIPDLDLEKLKAEALEILPTAQFFYPTGKEAEMRRFQDFRDRILAMAME